MKVNNNFLFIYKIIFKLKNIFIRILKKYYVNYLLNIETRLINKAFLSNNKKITIVLDEKVTALAYGEYINFLFLCRYFILNNQTIAIYFINDEYRKDFEDLNHTSPVQAFLKDKLKLIELVVKENYTVEIKTWNDFKQLRFNDLDFILLKKLVKSRKPIYNLSFNLNSLLLKKTSKNFIDKFLLTNKNTTFDFINKLENEKYITIGVRYNNSWRVNSNNTLNQINILINTINNYFSNIDIVILSDKEGCNFFRNSINNNFNNCNFSDDLHPGFIGSLSLILNSKYYFQFNGGGIATGAIYSKIPYIISQPLINEFMFKKFRIAPWSQENQFFLNNKNVSIEKILNKYLYKIS